MLYVMLAIPLVLMLAGFVGMVWVVADILARINRLERMRRLAGDPFCEPFGEIAPLPAGSILELHEHTHSARPASQATRAR